MTQEVAVDDQVLLYLIYDIDRKNGFMPSAEFLGFQHYKQVEKPTSVNSAIAAAPPPYPTANSSRRHPSVSYTLAPNPYSIPMTR